MQRLSRMLAAAQNAQGGGGGMQQQLPHLNTLGLLRTFLYVSDDTDYATLDGDMPIPRNERKTSNKVNELHPSNTMSHSWTLRGRVYTIRLADLIAQTYRDIADGRPDQEINGKVAAVLKQDWHGDTNIVDNAETVYISSLALLKMLRHGRAGVPMEVMGLMLGEFVDDYTVRVVDVFAMPQSGTGVSVEAVDPVFQTKMMDMLRQTGRPETVVGWYHSHPGFGCWLSSVDINTQQSFEQLTPRAVAVVIDPIQSVKGKVVIDAFRLINPQTLMLGQEPRQTTSNLGHLNKPSIQALIHGLNRHYYSIGIGYRKSALEEGMLMNLHKTVWTEALTMPDFATEGERNHANLQKLMSLAEGYEKRVKEETELTKEQLRTRYVGKVDPKKHIESVGQQLIEDNIVSVSRQMIDKEASVPSAFEGKTNGANALHGNGNTDGMQIDDEDD